MKLENIEKLSRWKKSWINIGSRKVPHRLKKYEKEKYERALKKKYLEIHENERINIINIWDKVCESKKWKKIIFIKNNLIWSIEIDNEVIFSWDIFKARELLKKVV